MRGKLGFSGLVALGLVAGCSDAVAPDRFGDLLPRPEFAIVPSVAPNGQFNSPGSTFLIKGFNPVNPHRGDAIIATFFWSGSATITSVTDHQTNGTPIGNTYTLVESRSAGGITMATYVAVNIQNFPDGFDERVSPGDSILVVRANLSGPITSGGMMITAWSGVQPTIGQALGAHSSGSGTSDTETIADAGTIPVNPGALVYAVTMANQVAGADPAPPPFVNINIQSDPANTIKGIADRMVQGSSAGSAHPTWLWGFNAAAPGTHPATWLASVIALNEAPTSSTGNLTVTSSTTGSNLDPDGYAVTVDGGATQAIATNGSVTFTGLSAGSHSVALSGIASNCAVSGANPRTVTVPAGGTASTTFTVTCSATTGNLTVSTSTTGSNIDPDGYTVTVDGGASQAVATNGSVTFTGLSAGSHSVQLTGVAGNCSVSGANPQTVTVPWGGTASTTFTVTCSATTGNLTVSTSTSGSSLDPDGYTVTVDGNASQAVAINGSVTFTGLSAGSHSVQLSGVAGNCTVSGSNPRTVNVPSGGTGSTTFTVSCSTPTGNLTVSSSTSGSSLDPDGYTVTVDGGASQAIAINGSVTFTNLSAGSHSVQLTGVAGNCTVSGSNPRTVNVPSGGTGTTTFSVSCSTPPGNLQVNTSTTGSGLDPDGYTATVDGATSKAVAINGSVTFTGLSAGSHSVVLSGVASNCTVSGGTSRTVTVPSGGTATVSYSVTCTQPNQAPVVNAGPDQTALTGLLYSSSQSFTDGNGNGPWTYRIEWGDGSVSTGTRTGQGSFTVGHTYVTILPKSFTVRVTVTDAAGASGSDTKVVTVLLL